MARTSLLTLLATTGTVLGLPSLLSSRQTSEDYYSWAELAAGALFDGYDSSTGLWDDAGWWISANCFQVIADLREIDGNLEGVTSTVFPNTLANAPNNRPSKKVKRDCPTCLRRRDDSAFSEGWLNDYYDDEAWWALAMMKAYDLTNDTNYLDVSRGIMDDILNTAQGASCGGIYWDRPQTSQTSIANSLALNTAAQLATRVSDTTTYRDWANSQWDFLSGSGLIGDDNLVVDGFDTSTCTPTGTVYTYNQGSMIGAMISVSKMNSDTSLLDQALDIANAAIDALTDDAGVLHESGDEAGSLGTDGAAFKGVMARNIQFLAQETGDQGLKDFLDTNAQALWNSRNSDGRFGVVWGQTTDDTDSSSQASALNALVGAAALSG